MRNGVNGAGLFVTHHTVTPDLLAHIRLTAVISFREAIYRLTANDIDHLTANHAGEH